jgi:hypothetical protein
MTSTSAANCRPLPPPGSALDWVPADLPLPPGTYAVRDVSASAAVHHGVFAVRAPFREFVRFALTQWPPKGWRLGRGDSESNEADDDFTRAKASGSFKVRGDYCDTNWSELNLVYSSG